MFCTYNKTTTSASIADADFVGPSKDAYIMLCTHLRPATIPYILMWEFFILWAKFSFYAGLRAGKVFQGSQMHL